MKAEWKFAPAVGHSIGAKLESAVSPPLYSSFQGSAVFTSFTDYNPIWLQLELRPIELLGAGQFWEPGTRANFKGPGPTWRTRALFEGKGGLKPGRLSKQPETNPTDR